MPAETVRGRKRNIREDSGERTLRVMQEARSHLTARLQKRSGMLSKMGVSRF